jgi:hypothetical protein
MRAALVRQHGRPPELGSHPAPRRGPGQALIRVTAAPVNPLDLLCASGTSYFGPPALPYAPGAQGVGVIEEAHTLAAGQRVWFSCGAGMQPGDGAMAELCVADESSVLPLPGGVPDDLAAALGLSAIAAWMALTWRGGLLPGEHVLVLGASGTVGQVGSQAARRGPGGRGVQGQPRPGPRGRSRRGRGRRSQRGRSGHDHRPAGRGHRGPGGSPRTGRPCRWTGSPRDGPGAASHHIGALSWFPDRSAATPNGAPREATTSR